MSRGRLIFVIFYLTGVLIGTVNLRTASARLFYQYRGLYVARGHLRQELWQKQLEFESLINPGAIYERVESENDQQ